MGLELYRWKETIQPTALVVDNDFFFVELLSDILISRDYKVIKAYDGREGIEQLQRTPVDLIFVDLLMPKINGVEFIAFVRDFLAGANIPLILISGALVEQIDRLQAIGADFCIAKGPFEKTAEHVYQLLDSLNEKRLPALTSSNLLLPDTLFPRQDTMELMQAVDFYHSIFEGMGVGLLMLDRDSRIIKANRCAMIWLQLSLKDILLKQVVTVFPEEHRNQLLMAVKELVRHPYLDKIAFPASLARRTVSVIVTCLRTSQQFQGWIIILAEVEWMPSA